MIEIILLTIGAVFGSFLNVCIYRIPRKISLVKPASFCPHCRTRIPFYHNIPLLSYLILKGRCHSCKKSISFRYPVVEGIAALFTLLTYLKFGLTPAFLFYTVFIYFLIAIGFIDLSTKMIYNQWLIYMFAAGIILNVVLDVMPWIQAGIGFLAGGGIMLFFALLGQLLFKKESLGMGDVKFAAIAGFFLGWKLILFALFFGFVIAFAGMMILVPMGKIRFGEYLPLGPFLVLALIIFVYWGSSFVNWYWNFFSPAGG